MATFDQAQKFRLGQVAGIDSTQVLMFSGTDIPEAPWHGMLIYRSDLQQLHVYRSVLQGGFDAFEPVTGGVAGQLIFVGDIIPVSINIDDLWYDTGHNRTLYHSIIVGANEIVAGEWELLTGPLTPDELNADGLLGSSLNLADLRAVAVTGALLQTRKPVRRGVKVGTIGDVDGLYAYKESGELFFKAVPEEGAAQIVGEAKLRSLTVSSDDVDAPAGGSLGGAFEIPTSATMTIGAGLTAPVSKPIVSFGHETTPFAVNVVENSVLRSGLAWDGTFFYTSRTALAIGTLDRYNVAIERWTSAGLWAASMEIAAGGEAKVYGIAQYDGWVYCLYSIASNYYLGFTDFISTGSTAISRTFTDAALTFGQAAPTLGFDHSTNELLFACIQANLDILTLAITPLADLTVVDITSPVTVSGAVSTALLGAQLAGYCRDTYDFGGLRDVWITRGVDSFTVMEAGVVNTDEGWPSAGNSRIGFAYMDDHWTTLNDDLTLRHYTNEWTTTVANRTKYVVNTFASSTAETVQSPYTKVLMPNRSTMYVDTSVVPYNSDADHVIVYAGQGATYPGRLSMFQQRVGGLNEISFALDTLATTGLTPPTAGTFAESLVPGAFNASSGGFWVDGKSNGDAGSGTFRDTIHRVRQVTTTAATYIPAITDVFRIISVNHATGCVVSIPTSVFAIDDWFEIYWRGAGTTQVSGTGITLNAQGLAGAITTLNISGRHGKIRLWQRATDIWVATGDVGTVV